MSNESARDKGMDKLVEAKLRSRLSPGSANCLDAELLAAYVERTLTSSERADCESHLAACAHCQEEVAMLARLAEADEPAPVQIKARAPARAAGFNWFRWAWAGPTLAALLVIGIYLGGPFKNEIRHIPGPESRIENHAPLQPATPPPAARDNKNEIAASAASESGRVQVRPPAAKKSLDLTARADASTEKAPRSQNVPATVGSVGGISAEEQSVNKTKNEESKRQEVSPTVVPSPVPAGNPVVPPASGAIATPTERAALAKDDRARAAGSGATITGGAGGREAAPPAAANSHVGGQQMGNLSARGRTTQSVGPQSVPPAAPEKTAGGQPALQDEIVSTKEVQSTDGERDKVRDNDLAKKQTQSTLSISSSSHGMMSKPSAAVPIWRVGRHGMIRKLNDEGNWKKQKSGVKADLYAISFSSVDVGWAVGQAGTVLRTTDGGATWTQVSSPTAEDLVQVTATGDQAASVSTRGGETFKTIDGGQTWTDSSH